MSATFLIKLKDVHEQSGKSIYRVAKETGLVYNTVSKYVTTYVVAEKLTSEVIQLAAYYGANWRDPAVVAIIEEEADTQQFEPLDDEPDCLPLPDQAIA